MIEKSTLEQLYLQENLSMAEIANRLGVTHHKVVWWMQQYAIPRRNQSESTYVKRNPQGDPFSIKIDLTPEEKFLLGLGLGLYWGEGNKANTNMVRLGNSDPDLVKMFIKFFVEICQVRREKIRFGLIVFGDIDQEEAINYWIKELGFEREHFHPKIVVIAQQGYRNKCEYGVVSVMVCNKKLRDWILDQIGSLRIHVNKPT